MGRQGLDLLGRAGAQDRFGRAYGGRFLAGMAGHGRRVRVAQAGARRRVRNEQGLLPGLLDESLGRWGRAMVWKSRSLGGGDGVVSSGEGESLRA
jgi:hypothetical protein